MTLVTNLDSIHATQITRDGHIYHNSIASFQRPADTSTYANGDVVSDSTGTAASLVFPDCAKEKGGSGVIHYATLTVDDLIDAVSPHNFELFLFTAPPKDHLDNATMNLLDADLPKVVAAFTFTGAASKILNNAAPPDGARLYIPSLDWERPFVCDDGDTNLYGLLRTAGWTTPGSGDKFVIRLGIGMD